MWVICYTYPMKTAIIVHGMLSKKESENASLPPASQNHWLSWLQQELLKRGVAAETPNMPMPYNPDYQAWKKVFEKFSLDENTILVGHSCGAGFIVRYLSEHSIRVGKVVLVAPWIDPRHVLPTGMFDFIIDSHLATKTNGLTVFSSANDMPEINESIDMLKSAIPNLHIVAFENKGHFCYGDMGTDAFPELLTEALAN